MSVPKPVVDRIERHLAQEALEIRGFSRVWKRSRWAELVHGLVHRSDLWTRAARHPDNGCWLLLDPAAPAWERLDGPNVELVSHASAAELYDVGDLRADVHEFTLPRRRQTRRRGVRLHRGHVPAKHRVVLHGLPVTRAGWMVGDLLEDHVDPETVARITAEVIDRVLDYPAVIAERVAPFAARFDFPRGDGLGVLDQLLTLA